MLGMLGMLGGPAFPSMPGMPSILSWGWSISLLDKREMPGYIAGNGNHGGEDDEKTVVDGRTAGGGLGHC